MFNIKHLIVDDQCSTLEGYVRQDADLDSTFILIEVDTGIRFRVNGWMMVSCEEVEI